MDTNIRALTPQDFGFLQCNAPSRLRPLHRLTRPGRLILDLEPTPSGWECTIFDAGEPTFAVYMPDLLAAIRWFEETLEISFSEDA